MDEFLLLSQEFTSYSGPNTVYPKLVVCHERPGNDDRRRRALLRMMTGFDPAIDE